MRSLSELVEELDAMTGQGKILEALEAFYDDDCVFQEGNDTPRAGKDAQRAHLSAFFASLKGFNGATLHRQGVDEQRQSTFSEWTFDMTGDQGQSIVWNEVLLRQWHSGKVTHERFYTA